MAAVREEYLAAAANALQRPDDLPCAPGDSAAAWRRWWPSDFATTAAGTPPAVRTPAVVLVRPQRGPTAERRT